MSKRSNSTARLREDKRQTKEHVNTAAKRDHGQVIDHIGDTNLHVSDTFMKNKSYADNKDYLNVLDEQREDED